MLWAREYARVVPLATHGANSTAWPRWLRVAPHRQQAIAVIGTKACFWRVFLAASWAHFGQRRPIVWGGGRGESYLRCPRFWLERFSATVLHEREAEQAEHQCGPAHHADEDDAPPL